jgi:hypothetical protein
MSRRVSIFILGFLIAVIAIFGYVHRSRQGLASISQPTESPEEQTFNKPIDVDWVGQVYFILQAGHGYGLKKDNGDTFMAFYKDNTYNPDLHGQVEVKGKWLGIDCAYRNTVFNGKCVPYVEIDKITTHN